MKKINGMNLGASPEPRSAASSGELYPTFSSADAEREGGLKFGFLPNIF
ncbi:MAG: hypothetical protein M1391_14065 [Bacteroidetes bacterium]|nr:hypothetical protein [Bacteroidota bacterium]